MYRSGKSDDPVHTDEATKAAGNPLTSNTAGHSTTASRMPGSFADDTETTASVKSGIMGEPRVVLLGVQLA